MQIELRLSALRKERETARTAARRRIQARAKNHSTVAAKIEITNLPEVRIKKEEVASPLQNPKGLKSIYLITNSVAALGPIFLVLDELFQFPIRRELKNNKGEDTFIKKLYDIAYFVDAPDKKVLYDKNLADSINNKLFKIEKVAKYIKTNRLETPTLVIKSGDGRLVLKNDIVVKTGLIHNDVPLQYQSLYIDKIK